MSKMSAAVAKSSSYSDERSGADWSGTTITVKPKRVSLRGSWTDEELTVAVLGSGGNTSTKPLLRQEDR